MFCDHILQYNIEQVNSDLFLDTPPKGRSWWQEGTMDIFDCHENFIELGSGKVFIYIINTQMNRGTLLHILWLVMCVYNVYI